MHTEWQRIIRFLPPLILVLAASPVRADSWDQGHGMMGMGGHGMGQGHGMTGMGGPGMMGQMSMVGLTDDQRKKINAIADENRKKMWQLMGQRMDEQAKLRDLYGPETLDAGKILAVHDRMHRIKREMVEAQIRAHNAMLAVLTPEQREQLKNMRRGMPMGPGGGRGGMPGPGMMRQ